MDVVAEDHLITLLKRLGKPVTYILPEGPARDRLSNLVNKEGVDLNFVSERWEVDDFESVL